MDGYINRSACCIPLFKASSLVGNVLSVLSKREHIILPFTALCMLQYHSLPYRDMETNRLCCSNHLCAWYREGAPILNLLLLFLKSLFGAASKHSSSVASLGWEMW